jgi:glycerol kinase
LEKRYVMAIDQGTTSTRVILFDHAGDVHSSSYREIRQYYPKPGWVEHDPREYWETVMSCTGEALTQGRVDPDEIAGIGITDQRETTILWDRKTGTPLYNAIVWQCRRTSEMCDALKAAGHEALVRTRTGLFIDAYFSGTKIKWIIENVPGVKEKVQRGEACMGTVDSWIVWNLSAGGYHVTDYSNAARTMLLNTRTLQWDDELLAIFDLPRSILPDPKPSCGVLAETAPGVFFGGKVPIAGVAGDPFYINKDSALECKPTV